MSKESKRPLILVLSSFYLPGQKSGGGTRTIVNTVDRLSDRYEFRIITRNYDSGEDKTPYIGIETGCWNQVGAAKVLYLRKERDLRTLLPGIVDEIGPSVIYANSFFSRITLEAMILRKTGGLARIPFILAPCGELAPGALGLKWIKKKLFVGAAKLTRLYSGLIWKASNEIEAQEIRSFGARDAVIRIAADLPPKTFETGNALETKPAKTSGKARFVFLSRFDRKKNLKWLLENVEADPPGVLLDVFGTVQETAYLNEFLRVAREGRHGFEVSFKGPVRFEDVLKVLADYHFFVMPTLGENFGHVFLEALSAGCPLVISDRTPWTDLEQRNAGWTLPLEDVDSWRSVISQCISMPPEEYERMAASARRYAEDYTGSPDIEQSTTEMFELAVGLNGNGMDAQAVREP